MGLNLRGLFLTTKYGVPHLKASQAGRIINIASVHAFGGGGGPAYAPAKAAVVNLTRDAAVELGRDNITVNTICPGYIETAIQDYLTPDQIEECRRRTPLPRLGLPKDIGRACVFLVDCSVSFGINYGSLLFSPSVHIASRPGPSEGVSETLVVLWPTAIEMVNQMLPRLNLEAVQVSV